LGVEQFGVYAIATTAGNFLRILLDGGFVPLLQRESAKSSQSFVDREILVRYAMGYTFLVMLFLSVIVLINPFNQHRETLFAIIFAFTPIVLTELSMSLLRGQGRLARDAILQVASRSITAFFIVLVLLYGFVSPSAILFAQATAGFALYLILIYRSRLWPLFSIPLHLFKTLIPLAGYSLAVVLYSRSDLLLCRIFDVERSDVGLYGLACRLVEALQVFVAPLAIILFRKFRMSDSSKGKIAQEAMKYSYQALVFGAMISGSAFLFSPIVIPSLFGTQYEVSASLFNILSIGFVFFLGNTVLFQAFIALELQRSLMILTALVGIFNVILNAIALPIYGIEACAWISVLTQCLLTLLLRFFLSRSTNT